MVTHMEHFIKKLKLRFPSLMDISFTESDRDKYTAESTPAGPVETVYFFERPDFEKAVTALTYRDASRTVPSSMGAALIKGLLDHSTMKKVTLIILSRGGYSGISCDELKRAYQKHGRSVIGSDRYRSESYERDSYESESYESDSYQSYSNQSDSYQSYSNQTGSNQDDSNEGDSYETDSNESDSYKPGNYESDSYKPGSNQSASNQTVTSGDIAKPEYMPQIDMNCGCALQDLTPQKWEQISLIIRKNHELAHFIQQKQPAGEPELPAIPAVLRDEILADMHGIVKAFGTYDGFLARLFLGIEDGSYRQGGRLENYLSSSEDPGDICRAADSYISALEEYSKATPKPVS